MNQTTTILFLFKIKSIVRDLRSQTYAKMITGAVGMMLLVSVGLVIFHMGKGGLEFVRGYVLYANAFTLYIYELYLAVLFYIVCFSSVMLLLFTLFRGDGDTWVAVSPKFQLIPSFYLLKIVASSLLSIIILALPMTIAIAVVFHMGILQVVFMLGMVLMMVVIAILLSIALVFWLSKLLYALKSLSVAKVFILCLFVFDLILFIGYKRAVPGEFLEFWQIPITDVREFDSTIVSDRFNLFISHPSARFIYDLEQGEHAEVLISVLKNIVILAVSALLMIFSTRNFLPMWQKLQEGAFVARTRGQDLRRRGNGLFPRLLKFPVGALFEKEWLVLRRDLKDISWITFIFTIWLMYAGLNIVLKRGIERYDVKIDELPNVMYCLQIAIGIYFVTAFVLRFVFPSFSTERKTSWIIGSAPIRLRQVLYSKLLFFTVVFSILGMGISIVNFLIFSTGVVLILLHLLLFLTLIVTVTFFGLFAGIIFPNFDSDNPEVLGTTMPGIIFTVASVLYGALGALVLYQYAEHGMIVPVFAFEVLSIGLTAIMFTVAPSILRRFEFSPREYVA